MTELVPFMMLRYYTMVGDKYYTATILEDNTILSLQRAGNIDNTLYESLIHWITSLPDGVSISDIVFESNSHKNN
jgi:hypothetical protein